MNGYDKFSNLSWLITLKGFLDIIRSNGDEMVQNLVEYITKLIDMIGDITKEYEEYKSDRQSIIDSLSQSLDSVRYQLKEAQKKVDDYWSISEDRTSLKSRNEYLSGVNDKWGKFAYTFLSNPDSCWGLLLGDELYNKIAAHMAVGHKIEAIKEMRAITPFGLKECTDLLESRSWPRTDTTDTK
jgi:hypothetical protein